MLSCGEMGISASNIQALTNCGIYPSSPNYSNPSRGASSYSHSTHPSLPVVLASTITRNHLVIFVIPTQGKLSARTRCAEQIN